MAADRRLVESLEIPLLFRPDGSPGDHGFFFELQSIDRRVGELFEPLDEAFKSVLEDFEFECDRLKIKRPDEIYEPDNDLWSIFEFRAAEGKPSEIATLPDMSVMQVFEIIYMKKVDQLNEMLERIEELRKMETPK